MVDKVQRAGRFVYRGWALDAASGRLRCEYAVDNRVFVETMHFDAMPLMFDRPGVDSIARLVFLLAGVSYYKTGAPPIIDTGDTALTDVERTFLLRYYVEGLGEFAFRNGLDLRDVQVVGPSREASPVAVAADPDRPLVPFGGGIDSIVVVEGTRVGHPDLALFVASRAGDRFAAIENAAAVSAVPVLRADREIDPQVLRSRELGFLNGHVPVTGILSAMAVLTALLDDRGTVVMSNEWSASAATVQTSAGPVNHQWSKSLDFETGMRAVLAESLKGFEYFSALRPYSELWVARRMAGLTAYHPVFRSCNRAFMLDPALRYADWCGECDKCCFIDLILAPFLNRPALESIFKGREPLGRADLEPVFRSLLGDPDLVKPFECVGDESECAAAVLMAANRADRQKDVLLPRLSRFLLAEGSFQRPMGPANIPSGYASALDLV